MVGKVRGVQPVRVNVLGGRDVGKTTIAMHAAAELRWLGVPTVVQCGPSLIDVVGKQAVRIRVMWGNQAILTPHEAAEMCRGALTFLVLRRKDYVFSAQQTIDVESARDKRLEETLRSGRVRYKSLPGCRASVQYVVKKICERVGYGK